MIGLPLLIDASAVETLVVGGGTVAERKVRALLAAGARVRVIAPLLAPGLRVLAGANRQMSLSEREYRPGDIGDATLVVAATDRRLVNASVASDARALRRLVVVADAPREGNSAMMAVHRRGSLLIAVSAGGVPRVAARIRDVIARRFDRRYGDVVQALAALRERLLGEGATDRWRTASEELIGADFCESVESGRLTERVAAWR